jgi:hypothetical protein
MIQDAVDVAPTAKVVSKKVASRGPITLGGSPRALKRGDGVNLDGVDGLDGMGMGENHDADVLDHLAAPEDDMQVGVS